MARRLMLAAVVMIGVFATAGSVMAADPGDAILGPWATDPEAEGGLSHVDIVKKNGTFSAKIVWLIDPNYGPDDQEGMAGQPKVDRNNPDKNKRDAPIIGREVVWGFTFAGDRLWEGGKIYDPDNGKTYKCKIRLADDGTLDVRGYIGFSWIGRTTVWTRLEPTE